MDKIKCPICGCDELQEIQDIHAEYYLPENVENGVRGQNSIFINQYICTNCGYLYQRAEGEYLGDVKALYSNTHSSGSYPLNFEAINKCNKE